MPQNDPFLKFIHDKIIQAIYLSGQNNKRRLTARGEIAVQKWIWNIKELDAGQNVRERSKIMGYVYIIVRIRNITSRPTRTLCEQNERP